MKIELPKTCFVSRSYDDTEAYNSLKKSIPRGVKLVPFAQEQPDPAKAVSDKIVPRILSCDGLIYLEGGHSAESGWVEFERDYALRNGKPVFAFDPETGEFAHVHRAPLDLDVQIFVSPKSRKLAQKMIKWMRSNRNFHIGDLAPVRRMKDVPEFFEGMAKARQLVIWLVDDITADHIGFEKQLEDEDFVLDVPEDWWPTPKIFARIDSRWEPESYPDTETWLVALNEGYTLQLDVDLIKRGADGLNWNRVDDLIVKITIELARLQDARV